MLDPTSRFRRSASVGENQHSPHPMCASSLPRELEAVQNNHDVLKCGFAVGHHPPHTIHDRPSRAARAN